MPDNAQPWWQTPAPQPPAPKPAPAPRPPTTPDFDATLPAFPFLAPPRGPGELGRLGKYRVLRELGRGGMGIVFAAEDADLHRTVALKVMLPEAATKPNARARFLREARAVAQLEHDHVVAVYQVDEDRGTPFLAMPLLRGLTLDDFLKKGRSLTVPQVLRIGREAARGLAAAHARGLVHRDVKPANLWLDAAKQGRVKLLDFGLARPTSDETQQLTGVGVLLGTPAYMAPEQARGDVDYRSDLYSLGAVLYRLLTGRLPVPGDTPYQILARLATLAPRPVRELAPQTPPALADLVMSLLAKRPEDRPQSADAVADALRAVERELLGLRASGGIPVVTGGPPAAAAATVALRDGDGDTAASLLTEAQLAPAAPRGSRLVPFLLALTLLAGLLTPLLFFVGPSPGGELALPDDAPPGVRVLVERDGREVAVLDADTPRVTLPPAEYRLRLADGVTGAALDADTARVEKRGRAVVALRLVPAPPRVEPPPFVPRQRAVAQLLPSATMPRLLLGPVRALAFVDDRTLMACGGKRVHLFSYRYPEKERNRHGWADPRAVDVTPALAVAPDGKTVAFALANGAVLVWDVSAQPPKVVATLNEPPQHAADKPRVNALAFAPDGKRLFSGGADGMLVEWDWAAGKRVSKHTISAAADTNFRFLAFLPGGRQFVSGGGALETRVRGWPDVLTFKATQTLAAGHVNGAALSADGRLLVTALSAGPGHADESVFKVWEMPEGNLRHTGPPGPAVSAVAFAPDSRTVAVARGKALLLWDAEEGVVLAEAPEGVADSGRTNALAFAPDGAALASGGNDHAVLLWDVAAFARTGLPRGRFRSGGSHLFNGRDLSGWTAHLDGGKSNETEKAFTVANGALRVSGKPIGALTTEQVYEDYRLTVEYRWGEATWPPRKDNARSGAVMVHCGPEDGVVGGAYPEAVEVKLEEGRTGSFVLNRREGGPPTRLTVEGGGERRFKAGAAAEEVADGLVLADYVAPSWKDVKGQRLPGDRERPPGEWNRLEIVCDGDTVLVTLNDAVVNRATRAVRAKGRVAMQSNGAEVQFRRVELEPLRKAAPEGGR